LYYLTEHPAYIAPKALYMGKLHKT